MKTKTKTGKLTKRDAQSVARCHPEYRAGFEAGMNALAVRIAGGWDYERQETSAYKALETFQGYVAEQMADIRANRS